MSFDTYTKKLLFKAWIAPLQFKVSKASIKRKFPMNSSNKLYARKYIFKIFQFFPVKKEAEYIVIKNGSETLFLIFKLL